MHMLYDSDSFVVVHVQPTDGEAPLAPHLPVLARHGFEIVDKRSGKEVYLDGSWAELFQQQIAAWQLNTPDAGRGRGHAGRLCRTGAHTRPGALSAPYRASPPSARPCLASISIAACPALRPPCRRFLARRSGVRRPGRLLAPGPASGRRPTRPSRRTCGCCRPMRCCSANSTTHPSTRRSNARRWRHWPSAAAWQRSAIEMAEEGNSTAHLAADATEAQVQTALSWNDKAWPWAAYGPVVMAAVRAGVPVVGANLPRERMKDAMADVSLDAQLSDAARAAQQRCRARRPLQPAARVADRPDDAHPDRAATAPWRRPSSRPQQPGKTVLLVSGAGHSDKLLGVPQHLPDRLCGEGGAAARRADRMPTTPPWRPRRAGQTLPALPREGLLRRGQAFFLIESASVLTSVSMCDFSTMYGGAITSTSPAGPHQRTLVIAVQEDVVGALAR